MGYKLTDYLKWCQKRDTNSLTILNGVRSGKETRTQIWVGMEGGMYRVSHTHENSYFFDSSRRGEEITAGFEANEDAAA